MKLEDAASAPLEPHDAARGGGVRPQRANGEAVELEDVPIPGDSRTVLLAGIFTFLFFCVLYFTAEITLPLTYAFIINLALQPAMRILQRLRLPRVAAAFVIIAALLGLLVALGSTLSEPATDWIAKAPASLPRLEDRLAFLKKPIAAVQDASRQLETLARISPESPTRTVAVQGSNFGHTLFTGTSAALTGFATMLILLFFLLISGDLFLRRMVEILPTLRNKKQMVEISREIERNVAGYLATICMMNAAVGVATGFAAYLCGMPDPALWGSLAFLLNFIPVLGPLCGIVLLFLGSLLSFDTLWRAVLPAAIYFVIHLVEGETVTPLLLARRFVLNPFLIVISLVFWYWMWGVAGALLAVPLLAITKIVCDRVDPLKALGHLIGAEGRN